MESVALRFQGWNSHDPPQNRGINGERHSCMQKGPTRFLGERIWRSWGRVG